MWHLLRNATAGSRVLQDGFGSVGGSPPPAPAPLQKVSQARTDLQQLSTETNAELGTDEALTQIKGDMAKISGSPQNLDLARAREILSKECPSPDERRVAVNLLINVANERMQSLQGACDRMQEHFMNIPADQAPALQQVEVHDVPLPKPPPEFIHIAPDVPPPLQPVVVEETPVDLSQLMKPR